MLEGRQFGKGDLLGVTGYLKERQWTDSQGQTHRLNELVVTDITKHLPKGMGKPQAQAQELEMPIVVEEASQRYHPGRRDRLAGSKKRGSDEPVRASSTS